MRVPESDSQQIEELAQLVAEILGNPPAQCQSEEDLRVAIDRWTKEVREPWLRGLRDHLLGRFPDSQMVILKAFELLFNPSKWPGQSDFCRDSYASADIAALVAAFSDAEVFVDGLDKPSKRFHFITEAGIRSQLATWKQIAFATASAVQHAKDASVLQKRRAGQPDAVPASSASSASVSSSDSASSSSASSVPSSESAAQASGSGSFRNPVLRKTDRLHQRVHGESMLDDSDSCVTASSFNFSGAPRQQSKSADRPFPDVTMAEFIKAFHQRSDHLQYKQFCILMQIAMTLLIHTTSNERGFSLLHRIMVPLRNRITTPLLDALMRIAQYGNPLSDADYAEFVEYWHGAKTRRVKLHLM